MNRFLAAAGEERDGRAAIEQGDRGNDLLRLDGKFRSDAGFEGEHALHYAHSRGAQQDLRRGRDLYGRSLQA